MAKTQVTGTEISDSTVEFIDLANDCVLSIGQEVKPEDFVSFGKTLTILENKQHVIVTEMKVEGEIILNGTLGII